MKLLDSRFVDKIIFKFLFLQIKLDRVFFLNKFTYIISAR